MGSDTRLAVEKHLSLTDEKLYAAYLTAWEKANQLLPRAYATFPEYTDHGPEHARKVLERVDDLLPDPVLGTLSAGEAFVLLAGAVLHDVGMAVCATRGERDPEIARATHHTAGADYVREHAEDVGVPSEYGRLVAQVVRHHRESCIADEVTEASGRTHHDRIRLPLLCALVRAGDELHITKDRAPIVVMLALGLSPESTRHFLTAQRVSKVSVSRAVPEEIVVEMDLGDELEEEQMAAVLGKVNEQLSALGPVFGQYGLPQYCAVPDANRAQLIERKVALAVAEGHCEREEIIRATGETPGEVEEAIARLRSDGWVEGGGRVPAEGKAQLSLRPERRTFEGIAPELLRPRYDFRFARSPYARQMLTGAYFEHLLRTYTAHYDARERELRQEVLSHSPSALRILLEAPEREYEPLPLARTAVLDQALLRGLCVDLYRCPEEMEGYEGLGKAIRHLARSGGRGAGEFARLALRALSYKDVSPEEMGKRFMATYGAPEGRISAGQQELTHLSFSVQMPEGRWFLSPLHLLQAGADEHVSVELSGPLLASCSAESGGQPLFDGSGGAGWFVRLEPPQTKVATPELHLAARIDAVGPHQFRVVVDTARCFDAGYTGRIGLSADVDGTKGTLGLQPHCPTLRPKEALAQLRFSKAVRGGPPTHAEVVDSETGEVFAEMHQECAVTQPPAAVPDIDRAIAAYEVLAECEKRLGRDLAVPLSVRPALLGDILSLGDSIATMAGEQLEAVLTDLQQRYRIPVTRVHVVVLDHRGETVRDECPVVIPGLPTIRLRPGGEPSQSMAAHYFASKSPVEVLDRFMTDLARRRYNLPFARAKCPPPVLSEVHFRISEPCALEWEDVSELELSIRARPVHRQAYEGAIAAVQDGDLETAIELLREVVSCEPDFAEAHHNLGCALWETGDLERAELSLRNALSRPMLSWSASAHGRALLAAIALSRGDGPRALAELGRIPEEAVPAVRDRACEWIYEQTIRRKRHESAAVRAFAQVLQRSTGEAEPEVVYTAPGSRTFHASYECSALKRAKIVTCRTRREATEGGLRQCGKCPVSE